MTTACDVPLVILHSYSLRRVEVWSVVGWNAAVEYCAGEDQPGTQAN